MEGFRGRIGVISDIQFVDQEDGFDFTGDHIIVGKLGYKALDSLSDNIAVSTEFNEPKASACPLNCMKPNGPTDRCGRHSVHPAILH